MDVNVLRRVKSGLGANAYGQVVTVIVQLVGVPILLHAWGAQLYGEWLILFAIPAYLSMTDLGFSQSAGNDMTARVSRGDRAGALAVFQSLGCLVYSLAGMGLLFSAAVLWSLPLQDRLFFAVIDADSARWVLWLLAAEVFVRLVEGVNHAGFRASGDYAFHVSFNSTTRLVQFAGAWLAALLGGGPVGAAAAFLVVRAFATPSLALLLLWRHPWLHFGLVHAKRVELRKLLTPALANIAIPMGQALNIQGMVLVIGAVLGPLAVVVFSTLRTMTRLALQLVLAVSHAAEPEMAAAYGAGDRPLMRSLFVHTLRAGTWLALVAAAVLSLFGSPILDIWTHGRVPMHSDLFAWLLGSAVATVLWYGALIVLKAANRHLRAALVYAFASTGVVATAVLLLVSTGDLANAGLALLIGDAAVALYVLNGASRLLDVAPGASLTQAANPTPLLAIALRGARRALNAA